MEQTRTIVLSLVWLCFATIAKANTAGEILDAAGIQGGLIVHLGCGDGKLTAAPHASDSCAVQGLDTDPRNVAAARKNIQSLGLYGKVSADLFDRKLYDVVCTRERKNWKVRSRPMGNQRRREQ